MIEALEKFMTAIVIKHKHWYEHLCKFSDLYEYTKPKIPDLLIYQKPPRKNSNKHLFGMYVHAQKSVHINLLTALSCTWEEVDNTIAHEMCHAFQPTINHQLIADSRADYMAETRFSGHDAIFHLLMRHCRKKIIVEHFDEKKARKYYEAFRSMKMDEIFYRTERGVPQIHIFKVPGLI